MSLDTGQKRRRRGGDVGNKTLGLYNGKFTYLKRVVDRKEGWESEGRKQLKNRVTPYSIRDSPTRRERRGRRKR